MFRKKGEIECEGVREHSGSWKQWKKLSEKWLRRKKNRITGCSRSVSELCLVPSDTSDSTLTSFLSPFFFSQPARGVALSVERNTKWKSRAGHASIKIYRKDIKHWFMYCGWIRCCRVFFFFCAACLVPCCCHFSGMKICFTLLWLSLFCFFASLPSMLAGGDQRHVPGEGTKEESPLKDEIVFVGELWASPKKKRIKADEKR